MTSLTLANNCRELHKMGTPIALSPKGFYYHPKLGSSEIHIRNGNLGNGPSWVLLNSTRDAGGRKRRSGGRVWCSAPSGEVDCVEKAQEEKDGYLVREFGWGVRRMAKVGEEMRRVAFVQAEAFHIPVALFDNFFLQFFQAEVLSALIYRVRNSPPDRYTCLVAEPMDASDPQRSSLQGIVGVVDATVQREDDVLMHLEGAEEYIYVSGIAVLKDYRRRKVGSALLKACEALSVLWGLGYLVLRAYEDDLAALKLYTNHGYRVVSGDPRWTTTWIGRRRRVLMIKRS